MFHFCFIALGKNPENLINGSPPLINLINAGVWPLREEFYLGGIARWKGNGKGEPFRRGVALFAFLMESDKWELEIQGISGRPERRQRNGEFFDGVRRKALAFSE